MVKTFDGNFDDDVVRRWREDETNTNRGWQLKYNKQGPHMNSPAQWKIFVFVFVCLFIFVFVFVFVFVCLFVFVFITQIQQAGSPHGLVSSMENIRD